MEPITVATAFAPIIGLLRLYKGETQGSESREFGNFIDWLRGRQFDRLADLILGHGDLARSVRGLVEDRHHEVMAKLDSLERVLAGVVRNIDVFRPLAETVGGAQLSDQAVSVLRQLNKANESRFFENVYHGGTDYEMMAASGTIQVSEPRFITDDLLTLCELGFLRVDRDNQGKRIFVITRAGATVGESSR
jgi:hypothetical protein